MNEAGKVRLGLVGCGYWGPKVIRAAASLSDVEVAALVDLREDLRDALSRHYPLARSTATLSEALAEGPLDAVIVATNPATHVEVASEAIATTAATIMIFFIVAPNMLRVWDSARLEPHCRRRYGAEPKHGRAFVKPGPRRPRPGLRANR